MKRDPVRDARETYIYAKRLQKEAYQFVERCRDTHHSWVLHIVVSFSSWRKWDWGKRDSKKRGLPVRAAILTQSSDRRGLEFVIQMRKICLKRDSSKRCTSSWSAAGAHPSRVLQHKSRLQFVTQMRQIYMKKDSNKEAYQFVRRWRRTHHSRVIEHRIIWVGSSSWRSSAKRHTRPPPSHASQLLHWRIGPLFLVEVYVHMYI